MYCEVLLVLSFYKNPFYKNPFFLLTFLFLWRYIWQQKLQKSIHLAKNFLTSSCNRTQATLRYNITFQKSLFEIFYIWLLPIVFYHNGLIHVWMSVIVSWIQINRAVITSCARISICFCIYDHAMVQLYLESFLRWRLPSF